jgi:two-component system sensor kinase FixL
MTSFLSWPTVAWLMLAAMCLTLAFLHCLVWFRQREEWEHLSFSIAATAVAVITFMELMAMHAPNVAYVSALLRWVHLPILCLFIALVIFVRSAFSAGRLWLGLTACAVRVAGLILSFTSGPNLFFKEMTSLKPLIIWGDESIVIPRGELGAWYWLPPLSVMAFTVFILDAGLTMWRRGKSDDRRRALLISSSFVWFLVLGSGHTVLVNTGLLKFPYVFGFYFMPTLLIMSYELSNAVLSKAQLTHSLQISEAALRQGEQRMSLAANAANLGLWEWDIIHDEIWMTEKGRQMLGITNQKKFDFESFMQPVYTDDRDAVKRALQEAVVTHGYFEREFRLLLPGGQFRWISAFGQVEKEPLNMYGVTMDISRGKQQELEVQLQRQELTHLSRVTLLGEISSSLAHELNQPLAAILSYAQAALRYFGQEPPRYDKVPEILNDIVGADRRAIEVIKHMRQLLKKGEVQMEPLQMNNVIREVLTLLNGDLQNHNITVEAEFAPELPEVNGDRVQIQQVLVNLLLNACDAMADCALSERRLHIRSALSEDAVQVTVADQGSGIGDADTESVFKPFFTTKTDGLGLGLAICRSIVTAHGGKLWAESNSSRGAILHFTLPAICGTSS